MQKLTLIVLLLSIQLIHGLVIDGPFTFPGAATLSSGPLANQVLSGTFLPVPTVTASAGSAVVGLLGLNNPDTQFVTFTYTFTSPVSIRNRLFTVGFDSINSDAASSVDVVMSIQASTNPNGLSTLPNGDVVTRALSTGISSITDPISLSLKPRFYPRFQDSELDQIRFISFTFTYPINYDLGGSTSISINSFQLVDV